MSLEDINNIIRFTQNKVHSFRLFHVMLYVPIQNFLWSLCNEVVRPLPSIIIRLKVLCLQFVIRYVTIRHMWRLFFVRTFNPTTLFVSYDIDSIYLKFLSFVCIIYLTLNYYHLLLDTPSSTLFQRPFTTKIGCEKYCTVYKNV